jgi:hypothetical protein
MRCQRQNQVPCPTGVFKTFRAFMPHWRTLLLAAGSLLLIASGVRAAAPLDIKIATPPPPESGYFNMGESRRPDGCTLTVDSRSLRLDGKPWMPVMGEFHFSRYPESEWREELLKIKAGGVNIVATYVFWIHHEEVEGQFDWSGRRNLRQFVEACRDVGLPVIVRCGPWCHGEVRNGGLPDWVVANTEVKPRSEDPRFLEKARLLYSQIGTQLKGLLWKDGGPVVGVQVDNEYRGPASYLLALKKIARDAGLDVPLYTRTGWPALTRPMPRGEILPLYGGYAEGFWDREITPMPGNYRLRAFFSSVRNDSAIANDLFGQRSTGDDPETASYPYLTCEIGGGMADAYHRRVLIRPGDIESVTLVQVGSGSTLPGYYMYHGGVNPEGRLTPLNESQATKYPNDLPEKTYDFQAPLGEYGQLRPHYHSLRRLHLFLADFGPRLATMPVTLPAIRPASQDDFTTLRWCVRSDGHDGFVFVNNHQRLQPMPPKTGVQFRIQLDGGDLLVPSRPVDVPADLCFFWPFNLDLGGVTLIHATAQPVCHVDDGNTRTVFFAQTPGVPAEFCFDASVSGIKVNSGARMKSDGRVRVCNVKPGTSTAIRLNSADGRRIQIVLVSDADSLALWKQKWQGRDRVFLTQAGFVTEDAGLELTAENSSDLCVSILPAPKSMAAGNVVLKGRTDGVFRRFAAPVLPTTTPRAKIEQVRKAGPARVIPMSPGNKPVACAPVEADFSQAAVWSIKFPALPESAGDFLLRFRYAGDVARIKLDDRILTDHFYNGRPFEIGLNRHAPGVFKGELRLEILPLGKGAPIYLAGEAWPDFNTSDSVAELHGVEIVNRHKLRLTLLKECAGKP